MRVHILCVTKRPRDWVVQAEEEYLKRLRGQIEIVVREISPVKQSTKSVNLKKEADRILHYCPRGACIVALDERGALWSTEQLVKELKFWRETYTDVACLIGGAEGLAPDLLKHAHHRWALSPLTLPHQLARVILSEQLYRGWSVLRGHPYHRV